MRVHLDDMDTEIPSEPRAFWRYGIPAYVVWRIGPYWIYMTIDEWNAMKAQTDLMVEQR